MKTLYLDARTAPQTLPSVATVGFFDGVHRGHQYLIRRVIADARAEGMRSMVITFDRHPRQVLQQDYQPELLTTLDAKLLHLARTGVDIVVVLHFDEAMARLSARAFMQQVLVGRLGVRRLVTGYDNRFGHNRSEGFDDYVEYGRQMGMQVVRQPAFLLNGVQVSSSVVRSFLREGEIEMANQCLGYPFTVVGRVVDGFKKGRELGFPTANLDTSEFGQLVPGGGVYAVKARLEQTVAFMPAMTNIGTRPTFGGSQRTLETFIFRFHDNIYGKLLQLSFIRRIRSERHFEHVTQLIEQLKDDEQQVEALFNDEMD